MNAHTNIRQVMAEMAETHLDIALPASLKDIKEAYKRLSKEKHPDKGGDSEEFIKMKEVYDFLTSTMDPYLVSEGSSDAMIDGTPIWKLGLGLPKEINGAPCPDCSTQPDRVAGQPGKGYIERDVKSELLTAKSEAHPCPPCEGKGKHEFRIVDCKWCDTDGKTAHGTSCRACGGTHKYKMKLKNPKECRVCKGSGQLYQRPVAWVKHRFLCRTCRGTGEIEVLNPVLPKGRLW